MVVVGRLDQKMPALLTVSVDCGLFMLVVSGYSFCFLFHYNIHNYHQTTPG